MYSYNINYVYGDQNVQVPAHLNFGKYILERLKQAYKTNEVAVENALSGEAITYKDFTQYAVDLSVALTDLGVKTGDTVGIGSEKRVLFIPTAVAVVFSGAAYTPYDLQSGRAGLKHKLNLTRPKYFICSALFWKTYEDVLKTMDFIENFICFDDSNDIELSLKTFLTKQTNVSTFEPATVQGQTDTALILYSSGTTGMPKGVQLTHLNCILNSLPKDFEDESLKTMFLFGEWYHNYDTFMTYKFLSLGRRVVYVDSVTPENLLKSIQKCQVNITMLVPSLVGYLSKAEQVDRYDISSLKIIYCRSSPLHGRTIEAIKRRFPTLKKLLQGYGMTESGELTSESWGTKGPKVGSVGMASPGITLKVVDPQTREVLGPNQRGEICLRGPVFMKGYIGIEPSTYLDDQGFFLTGDLGYYDEDKYFYIVDRLKEIISYDGNKVAPLELETILLLHPGVREAGVVGNPAGDIGEEPTAFVVRQPGASVSEQELIDYVSAEVSPYMQLRGGVVFVPELPRNPRGKILRRRLREILNTL
ncbi:luciferin 4-monooxygenase-like isoform X1 [Leguminivora glycinivorella]|uniref:luciferin 4-monooxygenase-like isoform X1 n=1 Tax=Leguminivora glycinivorella TaxID=1035111 RepID=UPI00200DC5DA|nr:luciferin 4-monooxygenase-like isoform X1 [Leguminivora glycinivorella]